jgi:hypothetical protein
LSSSRKEDLYGLEDNLLLNAKFNFNHTVPYDPKFYRCEAILVNGPWDKNCFTSPMWDIIYYQYHVKRKLRIPWTEQAKTAHGPEYWP